MVKLTSVSEIQDRRGRDPSTHEPKSMGPISGDGQGHTIGALRAQLQQKDIQLRDSHAALLERSRRAGGFSLDDRQVNERFSRLSKSINDWVVTHFKSLPLEVSPSPEIDSLLKRSRQNYVMLLKNPRTKFPVLRGIVADIIVPAITSGELLGTPAFLELKRGLEAICKRSF